MNSEIQQEKKSFLNIFKENKKVIFTSLFVLITSLLIFVWFDYSDKNRRISNSEKFVEAKILLTNKKNNDSKKILENIIEEKDKTYSPLSLFLIIDRDLENNHQNILNYFNTVLSIPNLEKEDLNLLRLKKAFFISNDSNEQEILKLINPIINSDSVWKNESMIFLGDFYYSLKQYKKAKQYYINLLESKNNTPENLNEIERKIKLLKND